MRRFIGRNLLGICFVFVCIVGYVGISNARVVPLGQAGSDYTFSEIALSGDGQVIALTGRSIPNANNADGVAYPVDFYHAVTGHLIHSIQTIWPMPAGISLNEDGSLLSYNTVRGEIAIINTDKGNLVGYIQGCCAIEAGYTEWNPVNDLVVAFAGGTIFINNASTGLQDRVLFDPESQGLIHGVAWNSTGTKLAATTYSPDSSGTGVAQIQIWDTTESPTLEQQPILRFDGGGSTSLAWSPDDTKIASNARGSVNIYSAETGQPLLGFSTGDDTPIFQVAWSPDGTKIAAGGRQTIWIWSVSTREIIETFDVLYTANSIAWSPDSTYLYHNGEPDGIYRNDSPLDQAVLTPMPIITSAIPTSLAVYAVRRQTK